MLPWFDYQNHCDEFDVTWPSQPKAGLGLVIVMVMKTISGKPRCTGLWAWGDNHMRAVELYRESIEATQVVRVVLMMVMTMAMFYTFYFIYRVVLLTGWALKILTTDL